MTEVPLFSECVHTKRLPPKRTVKKEVADEIGKGFRTLPIFEKSLYEYNYKRYYSLRRNEYLRCRWESYVNHYHGRNYVPVHFVDARDYHFYKYMTMIKPSENFHTKTDFRYKLKAGPGVDSSGQMPIPQELLMKRGEQKPKLLGKRFTKPEIIEEVSTIVK